jgi:hypothetical protein
MFNRILLVKNIVNVFVLLLLFGCAGTSVQIIESDIKSRPESIVYVMPIGLPEEIGIAQDWRKTGTTITTKEGEIIHLGIFQYSFGEGDINILRNSLINSLIASQAFKDVIYLRNESVDTTISHSAFYVNLQINKTAMASGNVAKCLISGELIIKNEKESILIEDDIVVETKSLSTISAAKNKAIRKFVNEVIESFNKF